MNLLKYLINNVVIPLATVCFFIVGCLAAFTSALIEYCVLKKLFMSSYVSFISPKIISVLLVIILEYFKIYFCFLDGRQKHIDSNFFPPYSRLLKLIPLGLSLFCSLIFSVSTLYMSNYNEESINSTTQQIESQLNTDINSINKKYDRKLTKALSPYKKNEQQTFNDYRNAQHSGIYSQAQIKRFYKSYLKVRRIHNKQRIALSKEFNDDKNKEISDLKKDARVKINNLSNDKNSIYSNTVISTFLKNLTNIFSPIQKFNSILYFLIVCAIGISTSLFLELVISFTFQFVSIPLDKLLPHTNIAPYSAKFAAWCDKVILTGIQAICCVTLVFMMLLISTRNLTASHFIICFFSCFIAIVLKNMVFPSNIFFEDSITNITTELPSKKSKTLLMIKESFLQGSISFIGYVFLGFTIGHTASLQLDYPAIAVGFGNSLYSCISLMLSPIKPD